MSLIKTVAQNLRAKSNADKNENRASLYGAFNVFKNQTSVPGGPVSNELKSKAFASIGHTLEYPVIDFDKTVAIGNARTLTIADDENTSNMVSVTFKTYSWGFTMVPSMYHNNEIGYQEDFEFKFKKYLHALAKELDKDALTALSAYKTQVLNEKLGYTFTAGTVNVDFKDREYILGDLVPMMTGNDFVNPNIHIVGNMGVMSQLQRLKQFGEYNMENKQYQYMDKTLHYSNSMLNATDKIASGYAIENGNLGLLTRVERDALVRRKIADGHEWDQITLPLLDIPCGTYYYTAAVDGSGTAGTATADMTRTVKEHFGFSVDVAFVTSYNSDPVALPSPVIAFNIAKEV